MTEKELFDKTLYFLFELEGYGTSPGDTPTLWGITKRYQPGYYARIKAETDPVKQKEIAGECYYMEYWKPLLKIWEEPSIFFQCMFLQAVNMWGFIEQWARKYKNLIYSLESKRIRTQKDPGIDFFLFNCMDYYLSLCETLNPRYVFNRKQFRGWIARLLKIKKWAILQQLQEISHFVGQEKIDPEEEIKLMYKEAIKEERVL